MNPIAIDDLETGGANAPIYEVDVALNSELPEGRAGTAYRLRSELIPSVFLDALVVNKGSDTLVVSFHGATNRATTNLPRFERLRTLADMPVSSAYFSDPTLQLDPKIWLTWYTGWISSEADYDVHSILARWSSAIARAIGARRIIFTGSSGGGFAALQVGSKVPGSVVLAMNAQTDISRYLVEGTSYSQQKDYVRVVWPQIWAGFDSPESIKGSAWEETCDERVSALRTYSSPRDCTVYILQNIEEYHYRDHFIPFLEAAWAGGNFENIIPWTNRQGSAHVVPTLPVFKRLVERVLEREAVSYSLPE